MLDIIKTRIQRTGKLTLVLALVILSFSVLVFGALANILVYMLYMIKLFDYDTVILIGNIMRYSAAIVTLVYCILCVINGQWDLNYKLIIRHRLEDKYYSKEYDEYTEKIDKISIYEGKKYKEIGIIDLIKSYDLEKKKCLFCKINNHIMMIRDLDINNLEGDSLIIKRYKYIGKQLLNNSNLYGYGYVIDKSSKSNVMSVQYSDIYFKNSMEHNETDIKDSFKEDINEGLVFVKKTVVTVGLLAVTIWAGRNVQIIGYKNVVESNGTIVTSVNNGVKVVFDNSGDTVLMPKINTQLAQIKPELLEYFNENGWKIRITDNYEMDHGFYFGSIGNGNVSGATSFTYKYIIIPNNEDDIDASVIHEMGHVLDSWKYTMTSEWLDIYNREKDNYVREYAKTNQFEGFACAYMEYVIMPNSLKERCPDTFNFINNITMEMERK